jgi:hypothetical protein
VTIDNVNVNNASVAVAMNDATLAVPGSNDTVAFTGNNSTICMTGSNDVLSLFGSSDTIGFSSPTFGNTVISGFNPSTDVIQFNPALFANYAAAMTSTQQVGPDTVITYDAHDTITLVNVTASSLNQSNFHFG